MIIFGIACRESFTGTRRSLAGSAATALGRPRCNDPYNRKIRNRSTLHLALNVPELSGLLGRDLRDPLDLNLYRVAEASPESVLDILL